MSFKAMATGGSDGNCSDRRLENSGLNHRCIDYLPPVHHLSLFANHLSFSSQHIFANPTVTIEGWKDFLEVEMVMSVLPGSGDPAAKGMFG